MKYTLVHSVFSTVSGTECALRGCCSRSYFINMAACASAT